MTIEEYRVLRQKPRRSKYGNERQIHGAFAFDSKAEATRYQELLQLEQAGAIEDLVVHPTFELQPPFECGGEKHRAIFYEGDFSYRENGIRIVEDVKGVRTDVFKLKLKMFHYRYPHVELHILEV